MEGCSLYLVPFSPSSFSVWIPVWHPGESWGFLSLPTTQVDFCHPRMEGSPRSRSRGAIGQRGRTQDGERTEYEVGALAGRTGSCTGVTPGQTRLSALT